MDTIQWIATQPFRLLINEAIGRTKPEEGPENSTGDYQFGTAAFGTVAFATVAFATVAFRQISLSLFELLAQLSGVNRLVYARLPGERSFINRRT